METLAIVMIVKDEPIDRLVLLIDHLRAHWDQFIIVDTGSESYEHDAPLLREAGAEVYQVEWRNDFAWARNQTLEHVKSDWVLHLDGDEMPTWAMMDWIKDMRSKPSKAAGALFWTKNYWGGKLGAEKPYHWHIRLFRAGRGKWYRKVHELVMIDGKEEGQTRDTSLVVRAPKHCFLGHYKPAVAIQKSEALYRELGEVSR